MFGSKKPSPPNFDWVWEIQPYSLNGKMVILLVNHGMMGQKNPGGRASLDDVEVFDGVPHTDPDFEKKWADILDRAKRRCDILNKGTSFTIEEADRTLKAEKSLCGNCEKEFVGEDYLCPACKEERQ